MNSVQKAVIALIKAAVTGVPQPLPADFNIEDAQDIIRRHHIHSLA